MFFRQICLLRRFFKVNLAGKSTMPASQPLIFASWPIPAPRPMMIWHFVCHDAIVGAARKNPPTWSQRRLRGSRRAGIATHSFEQCIASTQMTAEALRRPGIGVFARLPWMGVACTRSGARPRYAALRLPGRAKLPLFSLVRRSHRSGQRPFFAACSSALRTEWRRLSRRPQAP
jgi:hypothetical protein